MLESNSILALKNIILQQKRVKYQTLSSIIHTTYVSHKCRETFYKPNNYSEVLNRLVNNVIIVKI